MGLLWIGISGCLLLAAIGVQFEKPVATRPCRLLDDPVKDAGDCRLSNSRIVVSDGRVPEFALGKP